MLQYNIIRNDRIDLTLILRKRSLIERIVCCLWEPFSKKYKKIIKPELNTNCYIDHENQNIICNSYIAEALEKEFVKKGE